MSGTRKLVIQDMIRLEQWAIEQQGTNYPSHRNHLHRNLEHAANMVAEYWREQDELANDEYPLDLGD